MWNKYDNCWAEILSIKSKLSILEQHHALEQKRLEEISLGKHQDRNESRQAAEASHSNCLGNTAQSKGQKILAEAEKVANVARDVASIEYPWGIYIAGPMSGYPNHNFLAFNEVAKFLRLKGERVVNPAELNPEKPGHAIAMRRDIAALLTCRAIMLLPGWEHSRGARAEFFVAESCEMQIKYWELECNRY